MKLIRTRGPILNALLLLFTSAFLWGPGLVLASDALEVPVVNDAHVQASATELPSGLILYRYSIHAQPSAELPIYLMSLDVASAPDRTELPGDGIGFDDEFIDSTLGLVPIIPVYSPVAPPLWIRGVTAENEMMWSTTRDPVLAGESRAPFELVSPGLPGIRTVKLESILVEYLPSVDDADAMGLGPQDMRDAVDAAALKVLTIGPVAPPANFTPSGFLAEIESLEVSARTEGWILPAAGIPALSELLTRLRSKLEREDFAAARQTSLAAIELVDSLACPTNDCSPAPYAITLEGQALLSLNLRYLMKHLPGNTPPVADAGPDQHVECEDSSGALVSLDASGSLDPDGDPLAYRWNTPSGIATGSVLKVALPLGESQISLTVSDGKVDSTPDLTRVRIVVAVHGLAPPMSDLVPTSTASPTPTTPFKQGRTLPLRLETTCGGVSLPAAQSTPPQIVELLRNGELVDLGAVDTDSGQANGSRVSFREAGDQWIFNLQTKDLAVGVYTLILELTDGTRHHTSFELR